MKTSNPVCRRKLVRAALGWLALTSVSNGMTSAETQAQLIQWLGDQPGGVAAAQVDADGVRFANAGQFSRDDARPISADTEFEIGSVTKVFTALLLADSVRAGKVKLDDRVGAPFAASGITYKQLVTHTSGLPRLPTDIAPTDPSDPYAEQDLATLVKSFAVESRTAQPTTTSRYSNFGFAVLGQALAGAWEQPYAILLKQRVLQPLGMRDTATSWREADPDRLAPGHSEQGAAGHWDLAAYAPAGALVSTTRDLAKFLQACLGFVDTPLAPVLAAATKPRVAGDTPARKIGLAWIVEQRGGTTTIWHNGGTGGFRSFIAYQPAKKVGVAVLTNHTRGVEALGMALLEGTPLPQRPVPTPAAEALRDYLGNYPLAASFVMAVTAEGDALFVQATNQPRLALKRTAMDEYAVEGVAASVSFERDENGKVVALVLHQNGANQRAPHLPPGVMPTKPPIPQEVAMTVDELEAYVGTYQLGPLTFTVKRDEKRLLVQLTGQTFLPVYASGKDEFFYKVVEAQLSFIRGSDGQVVALVLHQNGRDQRAEKIKN